jgi:hypothetical protein
LSREKRKRCSRDLHGRMRRESEKKQRRPRVNEKKKEQFSVWVEKRGRGVGERITCMGG